jgi:hypothetical protein
MTSKISAKFELGRRDATVGQGCDKLIVRTELLFDTVIIVHTYIVTIRGHCASGQLPHRPAVLG